MVRSTPARATEETRGAARTEGRAAALAGAIGRATVDLGPVTADAIGVEVPAGEGEVQRTHG